MRLPEEVMPTLYLTREEALAVESESNTLVRETIDALDAFVANQRALPREQWKRVKSKEGFDVFRTRKSAYDNGSTRPRTSRSSSGTPTTAPATPALLSSSLLRQTSLSSSSSSSEPMSVALLGPERSGFSTSESRSIDSIATSQVNSPVMRRVKQFPMIVLTGVIPGKMEDAMYGSIADNEMVWRLRSTYMSDLHRDCKILATLQRPSKEDPFRYFGIKWAWRKLPAFSQQRDMVYSENTGMLKDAQGKLVAGYSLMHSVQLPGIPELSQYNILRMKVSVCFVFRPLTETTVEYFCRAFCDPLGNVPMTIHAMIYAEALLASVNVMECSYMKKLMWLTRQRQQQLHARSDKKNPVTLETATQCQGCQRALKLFGGLNRAVTMCRCCRRVVCGKCSSERKIVLDVSEDGEVTQKPLPFCVQCVVEARALPALEVATATAVDWYEVVPRLV
ncbi:hypothetical protein Gpo141_00011253 [Globisporangium polare]